jgi:hypothetical protein
MKVTDLIMKLHGAPMVAKSRTASLVILAAMISVVNRDAAENSNLLSGEDTLASIGLGALGLLGCLMGTLREPEQMEFTSAPHSAGGEVVLKHRLAVLGSLKYWTFILTSSALITGQIICQAKRISKALRMAVDSEHGFTASEGQTSALALRE